MKLAIIHPFQFRFPRGIERFTWSLASQMVKRGVEVDILTWRWPASLNWGSPPQGLRIKQVPNLRYYMAWAAVPYYVRWLLKEKYDWVFIYFAAYGEDFALRLVRLVQPQRYCAVLHYPIEQVPERYQEFERFGLARQADRMIAVGPHVARSAAAHFQRDCEYIGNGVDTDQFSAGAGQREDIRERLGLKDSDQVLLSMAALEERKGLQWVIRALPLLLAEFPRLRYWILGEGEYRESLEAEVRTLGLEEHVWTPGAMPDVVPFLAAADAGCLLSVGEAYPVSMLEYMSMGLPVVTSCHPPFNELVRLAWGEMVNEIDTRQVATTLGTLLRNPLRRRAMGRAGRQYILDNCTWERVADQYLRVLGKDETPQRALSHA